jgi:hypothetical protein
VNHYKHLCDTFAEAERTHPDLMEPYSIRLGDARTADERTAVMRAGLRETIRMRFPLPERREVVAVDVRQQALAL